MAETKKHFLWKGRFKLELTTYLELKEYIENLNGKLAKTTRDNTTYTEVYFDEEAKPVFIVSEDENEVFKLNTFNLPNYDFINREELIHRLLDYAYTSLEDRIDEQYFIRILKSSTDEYGGIFINIESNGKFNLVPAKDAEAYNINEINKFADLANLDLSENLLLLNSDFSDNDNEFNQNESELDDLSQNSSDQNELDSDYNEVDEHDYEDSYDDVDEANDYDESDLSDDDLENDQDDTDLSNPTSKEKLSDSDEIKTPQRNVLPNENVSEVNSETTEYN